MVRSFDQSSPEVCIHIALLLQNKKNLATEQLICDTCNCSLPRCGAIMHEHREIWIIYIQSLSQSNKYFIFRQNLMNAREVLELLDAVQADLLKA